MDNFEKGQKYKESKQYALALDAFNASCLEEPETPESWHCAGHMAKLLNKSQLSKEYLTKAIELYDENDQEHCFWIGAAYALLENKQKALEYLSKAILLAGFDNIYRTKARAEEDFQIYANDVDFLRITKDRTYKEIQKGYEDILYQKYLRSKVNFKSTSNFDFYLAEAVYSSVLITAKTAQQSISDAEPQNLLEYLENNAYEYDVNKDGDIIGLRAHGDMWQADILDHIARYTEGKGKIILIDDLDRYWKVEFAERNAKYYSQV